MTDSAASPTPSEQDLLTTPFGAGTTALEVVEGVDLSGRRAVVTGGASGIGIETVRALADAGAAVTIAAANPRPPRRSRPTCARAPATTPWPSPSSSSPTAGRSTASSPTGTGLSTSS